MSRSLTTQGHFYRNQSGGAPSFLAWFHRFHAGKNDALLRRRNGRVTGLEAPSSEPPPTNASPSDPEALARLGDFPLSALPGDTAPIALFDTVPWRGDQSHTASAAGLVIETYREAFCQPLPLGDLDAPDRALRSLQAAWVGFFDERLSEAAQALYGRNDRDQIRIIVAVGAASVLGIGATVLAGPFGWLWTGGALAAAAAIGFSHVVDLVNQHIQRDTLKDLRNDMAAAAATALAATQQRQQQLIEYIRAEFDAAGHLREDADEMELSEKTAGHIQRVFIWHRLLSGNRQCTRLHVRALGMVLQSRGLQQLDQALVRRRRADEQTALSFPRIRDRLLWLAGAGLLAALPFACALGKGLLRTWTGMDNLPALPVPTLLAGSLAVLAAHACGWIKVLALHRRTDNLLSEEELEEMCQAGAFAKTAGPADVRLDTAVCRTTGRLLVRLLREEGKRR